MPTLTSLRLFVVAAFAVCICAWLIATRKLQVYRTESKELEGALFPFYISFKRYMIKKNVRRYLNEST